MGGSIIVYRDMMVVGEPGEGGSDEEAEPGHAELRSEAEGPIRHQGGGGEVACSIAYYDEAGEKLGSAPVMPRQYAAAATFASENPDFCGDWVEPVAIIKRQVAATALAEATVEVKPAGGSKADDAAKADDASKAAAATPKTGADSKASTSTTPKTGDFSPFVMGGFAIVALLGAGALALSLLRRRG